MMSSAARAASPAQTRKLWVDCDAGVDDAQGKALYTPTKFHGQQWLTLHGCCSFAGGLDGSRRGDCWHICSPWQRGGFLTVVAVVTAPCTALASLCAAITCIAVSLAGYVSGDQEYCAGSDTLRQVRPCQVHSFNHCCQSKKFFTACTATQQPRLCRPDIPVYAGADEPLLAHCMDVAHQRQSVVSLESSVCLAVHCSAQLCNATCNDAPAVLA